MKFSPGQIEDVRARNPVPQLCQHWGIALRAGSSKFGGSGFTGPCPLHSPDPQARDSMSFECDADNWVCVTCADGGDVFKLAAKRDGLDPRKDFVKMVEILGGVREVDEAAASAAAAARQAQQLATENERNAWRDQERGRAWDIVFKYGIPISRPDAKPARDYLAMRGVDLPPRLMLRFSPAARFYCTKHRDKRNKIEPVLVHEGPALLAPMQRSAKFAAAHQTWFDLDRLPKAKPLLICPKCGEAFLNKKMRGSKVGAHIDLTWCAAPAELVLAEGIEKALAVYTAMAARGRDLSSVGFWSAGDLGNLAGKHLELVPHPTEKTPTGRTRRVPGPLPDMDEPSIEIPPTVTRLVLLGDSTSDPFLTQCAMARAAARYRRQRELQGDGALPLEVVCAWSPAGEDFDDLLREASNG